VADTTAPPQEGDEVTSGVLYRRIFPNRDYFKPPPENRITSLNFLPAKGEADVSMYRAAETTPSEVLEGHEGFGLLMLDAEQLGHRQASRLHSEVRKGARQRLWLFVAGRAG
jgi:hypothetical protein